MSVESIRRERREWSARLRELRPPRCSRSPTRSFPERRWFAYELVYHHRAARSALDLEWVERLGRGFDDGARSTRSAATSPARRGAAGRSATTPSTAGPRPRTAGGAAPRSSPPSAEPARRRRHRRRRRARSRSASRSPADRDDMVVKALSWALRELILRDPEAVRAFLADPRPRGARAPRGDQQAPRPGSSSRELAERLEHLVVVGLRRRLRDHVRDHPSPSMMNVARCAPSTSCRTSSSRPTRRTPRTPRGPRRPAA